MAKNELLNFILASASPRRRELLWQIGIKNFIVQPADIDETIHKNENPRLYVARVAREKALKIFDNNFVLAADTIVVKGRRILDKTDDINIARKNLSLLSGGRHRVYGAICLVCPDGRVIERIVETRIKFSRISDCQLNEYLASNEWQGKAGSYAIQGLGGKFAQWINGSYTNIVGLSLPEAYNCLKSVGLVYY